MAALFIYLNRTGFNGLYRLNRRGVFNVPVGRYAAPRICDEDHLRAVAATLRHPHVALECAPYQETLADADAGDFVYGDPPYAPLSPTASFAQYTAGGFGPADQRALRDVMAAAASRGATVIISNSSAPSILRLYGAPVARAAGLRVHRVPARRSINSRAAARGPVDELVITNARRRLDDLPAPVMLRAGMAQPAARKQASR
jgi:DNA adenine methylase